MQRKSVPLPAWATMSKNFPSRFNKVSGLAYYEYGDPTSNQVVVFHHGWPSAGSQGALFDQAAKECGVRLLSPSRPGIAGSRMEAGRGFAEWPARLSLFLDDLGVAEKVFILGVSGGGPYSLAACAGLPERVERAGVICGAGEIGGSMADMVWPYRVMARLDRYAPWALSPLLKGFRAVMKMPGGGSGPGTKGTGLPERDRLALADPELHKIVSGSFSESMAGEVAGVVADGRLYVKEWNFDPASIRVPVQFWHGRMDKNIPPRMPEALAGKIAHARLEWFDDDGHYSLPMLRARTLFIQLVTAGEEVPAGVTASTDRLDSDLQATED